MRIRCLAFIPVATLCLAGPASAQNLGDMFKRAAKEARQEIERKVEDKSREAAHASVRACDPWPGSAGRSFSDNGARTKRVSLARTGAPPA